MGDASVLHREMIKNVLVNKKIRFSGKNKQNAHSLGIIVSKKAENGEFVSSDNIIPVYLRKSQAERMKNESTNS